MGPELIVNGTFDTDFTDWYVEDPVHTTIISGRAFLDSDCTIAQGADAIGGFQLVLGHTYRFSFDYQATLGGPGLFITYAFGNQGIEFPMPDNDSRTFVFDFVASAADVAESLIAFNTNGGTPVYFDNVSLRETGTNYYIQTTLMVGAEEGDVQTINAGKSDDSTPIYFELETQELEFGDRGHLKKIADEIGVLTTDGLDSSLSVKSDVQDYKPIPMDLSDRVAIGNNINAEGHYFTFRWYGEVDSSSPVFEGLYLENVTDLGVTDS